MLILQDVPYADNPHGNQGRGHSLYLRAPRRRSRDGEQVAGK